jgi:hypothetical protein
MLRGRRRAAVFRRLLEAAFLFREAAFFRRAVAAMSISD